MDVKQLLECGRVVNTHGLRGEVKIEPWCDSSAWFCQLSRVFIDGAEVAVERAYVQGRCVIATLSGVSDVDAAMRLRGKVLLFDRADVPLADGDFYIQDAIGLPVFNQVGAQIGVLADIINAPASDVFVVRGDDGTARMLPNVPVFVKRVDIANRRVDVSLIDGM